MGSLAVKTITCKSQPIEETNSMKFNDCNSKSYFHVKLAMKAASDVVNGISVNIVMTFSHRKIWFDYIQGMEMFLKIIKRFFWILENFKKNLKIFFVIFSQLFSFHSTLSLYVRSCCHRIKKLLFGWYLKQKRLSTLKVIIIFPLIAFSL